MLGFKESVRAKPRRIPANEHSSNLDMLPVELFIRMLRVERKRTERSGRRFILMLLDAASLLRDSRGILPKLLGVLARSTRDTDFRGWYKAGAVIGVIFTELGAAEEKPAVRSLSKKVTDALYDALTIEQMNQLRLSFHAFPEDWGNGSTIDPIRSTLELAMSREAIRRKAALQIKRLIDISGSLAALLILSPLFLAIAVAVKLTSRGPAMFKQVRLGQYGKRFTFLKFRSMYCHTDSAIHEEYVRRFITGSADAEVSGGDRETVYKLIADPRVTPLGRFLRQTSLDELPQFINVLKGNMSLVGPRPPVTYEFEQYDLWHKRRLSATKPGITGLWQVEGRSRVKFDDMVRLDIRYAASWSLWLDMKILIQTPRAIISGSGAC